MRSSPLRRRVAAVAVLALIPGLAAAATSGTAAADPTSPPAGSSPGATSSHGSADGHDHDHGLFHEAGEETSVIEVQVADTAELDELLATGVDTTHGIEPRDGGIVVPVVVTPSEAESLREAGYELGATQSRPDQDAAAALAERERTLAAARRANRSFAARADDPTAPDVSDVRIIRADYYTNYGQAFVSVEAKWADGQTNAGALTVERDSGPGTEFGSGGTQTITRFVDAGVYLYHRGAAPAATVGEGDAAVAVRPDRVRITSPSGDVAIAKVADWLPTSGDDPFKGPGYQEDFIDSYLDPTQLYDRIAALAEEFPDQAELVELPYASNGYRRPSQALLDPPGNRVVLGAGSSRAEYAYVPSTTLGSAVPAGGLAAAPVAAVSAAPNQAWPNATPAQGCGPFADFPSGAVAVVERGECGFGDKAVNAQQAGASAVLIANNVAGLPTAPGGTAPGVTIPVVAVSQADGRTLRAAAGTPASLVPGATPASNARVGLDSKAWGHEGGDDVSARLSRPASSPSDLVVRVAGTSVDVELATDAGGAITTTAAQVVAAIDGDPRASALVNAYTYRGSAGDGVVAPTRLIGLDDNLNAPDYVSHDPQPVYALRIGTAPEGEKPGVLAYAQEHAREWVPPLVTIETAERLLRNYGSHAPTTDLVDNLETWIAPSINPDGGHYSFYDFASQRRNMVRYCAEGGNYDVGARNAWGVDLNRNHEMYSAFDGYDGASTTNCNSDTFAGPSEHSEGEARNVEWLGAKDNVKFSMNLHSSGNYFMWSPGSYIREGRVTAPRPSLQDEQFFEQASEKILTGIKRHRGTSVTPARTGVTADVLYSAAGNSGDQLYYKHDVYAWNFETGVMFQPPFTNPDPTGGSAQAESMEFANGLIEMLRVARELEQDTLAPTTVVDVAEAGTAGKVNVTFDSSEAVEIRYTLDGTRPTATNGETLQANGVREGGETLLVDEGATIYWYATDPAGNVEGGYDPTAESGTGFRKWIAEVGYELAPAASTVELDLDPAAVRVGRSVEATVSVTSANDFDLAPSGVVTLTADGLEPQVVELGDDGTATTDLGPFRGAGDVEVTASYAGDDTSAASTSDPRTVEVSTVPTGTRVARQQPARVLTDGPAARTRARLVVRVDLADDADSAPAGWVQVRRAGEVIARGRVDAGRAVVTLPRFAQPGAKQLRVRYNGSATFGASATGYRLVVSRP
ncbi:M14 family zinc carboxypeptidase [Nocardioides lentus]